MADTDAILKAATDLGKLIAAHPTTRKYEDVLKRLDDDTDAQRLMTDLNRHRETLAEKEAAGKPIEVDDKKKMTQLQQDVAMSPILRDLQMAQMDYLDLMRKVDQRMADAAGPDAPAAG